MAFRTVRFVAALALVSGFALAAPFTAHAAVSIPGAIRVQQDVPGSSWLGSWVHAGTSSASGGTRAVGTGKNATFTSAFEGTAVSVIAERGPAWGKFDVMLDGAKVATVDLYAAKTARQTSVYKKTGLPKGRHVISLVATATRNAKSAGTRVNVDALDIVGTQQPTATQVRVEQTDARLFWDGRWSTSSVAAASGGSVRSAGVRGEEMSVEFKGTGITLVGSRGTSFGRAEVYLDGKLQSVVSAYAPSSVYGRTLFSIAGLSSSARHVLTVRVAGTHDSGSGATAFPVDAFDVRQGSVYAGWVRAEQTDAHLTHAGAWETGSSTKMSGGSYAHAEGAGSVYRAKFTGSAVRIVAPKNRSYGQLEVIVDGTSRVVDLYASSLKVRQRVVTVTGLDAAKQHSVEVRALGAKSSHATWDNVTIDAVDVRGTFDQAPAAHAFETLEVDQIDMSLSAGWRTTGSTTAYAARVASASGSGHSARASFTGTAIRLVAQRGPSAGKADIYVDGAKKATIDLYSASTKPRQVAWQASGLTDAEHQVVVKTTGTKHPSSVGTLVVIDRFEVTGEIDEPSLPSGTVRLQEKDPRVVRTGVWSSYFASQANGGAHTMSRDCLGNVRVKFSGTGITWIGSRAKTFGRAFVYIDNKYVATIDNYSALPEYERVLFRKTGLSSGTHTLRIAVDDDLARGSSYWVPVDAFDVIGTPMQQTLTFDHTDYHIGHAGALSSIKRATAVGGTLRQASKPATITVAFTGTYIDVLSEVGPYWGTAHVSVDGGSPVDVDLHRDTTSAKAVVFSRRDLAPGTHTLTFAWTAPGTHDSDATTNRINFDAAVVGGPLVGATPVARARDTIVRTALAQLGDPYVWGATGPDSFDCSGLVQYSYVAAGVKVPRVSRDQWAACSPKNLSVSQLLPGDLVFRDRPTYIHHVGIYLGNGVVIHAPNSGSYVQYTRADAFGCFGRIPSGNWPSK